MRQIALSFIFIILGLEGLFLANAQTGDLYLHHYQIPIKNIDNQNHAAVQGKNGIVYFANKKGVLSYDGVSWEIISTSNTPYSLHYQASSGRVYVGCREGFGYIATNKKGIDYYVSISDEHKGFGEILRILSVGEYLYFYSNKAIFRVSPQTNQVLKYWKSSDKDIYMGIAQLGNQLFLNLKGKGLHRLQNEAWLYVSNSNVYAYLYIRTSLEFDQNRVLLGLSNNSAYWFDGKKFQLYIPVAYEYLKGNVIHNSLNLSDNELAFATLSGGMIVIDKKTFATQTIINFQTGLPDDEVSAMCKDNQGGIWICHAKGISRADRQLPLRAFSGYAGLEGNLETVLSVNDSVYLATGDGLFYLMKVNRYEQIESLIKKEQRYLKTVETVTKTVKIIEPKQNTRVRTYTHSNLGNKVEKRRIETQEKAEIAEVPTRALSTELTATLFSTVDARKAYALQSIPYIYKKVKGLEGKCKQLIYHQGKLLIASNIGLFQAYKVGEEIVAQPILKDEYINFITPSQRKPNQFYVATNSGLFLLAYEKGSWQVKDQQKDLNSAVYSVCEFENQLWLGAESQVFRLDLTQNDKFGKAKAYPFEESYSENVTARVLKGKLAFILSSGIYGYDAKQDKVFRDAKLQRYFNPRSPVLYNQANFTWVRKGWWQNIGQPLKSDSLRTIFLELFEDIQDIHVDNRQNIWLISNNILYRVGADAQLNEKNRFEAFIRNVIQNKNNQEMVLLPLENLALDYSQQGLSFTFKMASPFYRHESATQYQYWLEGLSKEWTDWDAKAIVSFPYIPTGKYKLHIRAKNIFGQVSKEQVFAFEIKPPFWQTYWFYGLQILVLAGLFVLAYIFNRFRNDSRWAIVVTIVAIITLFEFMNLYFEPYVDDFANGIPVLKLGLNILLALTLLPAERVIRNFLQKKPQRLTGDSPIELAHRPDNVEDKAPEVKIE
ncbi:MAG: hypothetical protein MUE85_16920 [Microscillaceae bacterium]|jgi:ligand-binding sensor domain-containing protein|nr:hypothetical protein [Microscillaceae bacterium]